MIETLSKHLVENKLDPDTFQASPNGEGIFRGEVPGGQIIQTWVNLAKVAKETKYWPIIRGGTDDIHEQNDRDPAAILAAAPVGNIREILKPRFRQRFESLLEIAPHLPEQGAAALSKLDGTTDMDQLAAAADASGMYAFIGRGQSEQPWPSEPADHSRVKFHTLKGRKGQPSTMLLVRMEHTYEVPAYLQFGGWNECPEPELQVAVFREWQKEYKAVPACMTNDVLEFVVSNRPQTEAESMKIAAEQWIFCEDIVGQGTQSVRKLAMEIWKAPTWFFWWD